MSLNKRKIVYVLGAGRSGTTITGIVLGATKNFFHCGEINKFYDYNGIPKGNYQNKEVYNFYKKIYEDCAYKNTKLTNKVEYHSSFFLVYFNLFKKKTIGKYKLLQEQLFESLEKNNDYDCLIDSSKFPGRLLALHKFLKLDITVVYIVRNPISYLRTVQKKGVEQPSQSFIKSLLYYFIINSLSVLAFKKINGKKLKIRFEDLIEDPIKTINIIEKHTGLSFHESKELIKNNLSIATGNVFEGNRIRHKKTIKFKVKKNTYFKKNIRELVMNTINGLFY